MIILFLLVFAFLAFISPLFRLAISHPFKSLFYAFLDLYEYFKYHLYDYAPMGKINAYTADFGGGKTLSMVHDAISFYKRYNNKIFFDKHKKKWITQKVIIVSNVVINSVPYETFTGLSQLVDNQQHNQNIDNDNDTRTCCLYLCDEASSQLNSRQFSKNFNSAVLGALVTVRHFNTSFFYSTQQFNQTDALLRQDTLTVTKCKKLWRFQLHYIFNAHIVENAPDPTILKPLYTKGFFVTNSDYSAYDTFALVDNLSHSATSDDFLSESEILSKRAVFYGEVDNSHKLKKFRKK